MRRVPHAVWMQTFAVMCLCLFAPGAFAADGDASAVQLYEEAMTLYQQGEYEQALTLFEQVDAVQLNKDQREALYDATEDAQRQLSAQVSPGDLLKQADAAAKAGNAALAASLYGRVISHDASTDAQVQTATARLAEVHRQSNAEADGLRRMIADADADLKAGRLDAAEMKLKHVKASGVDLGWWDNRHVEQQLGVIAARRAQMGELAVALDDNGAGEPAANGAAADGGNGAQPATQGSDTIVQARQLLAQRAVVDARAAEQDRNYALASRHFREALALDPNNADAQAGVERVEAKLVGGAVGAGPLENELGMLELRIQAVQSKVNEQLAHARTEVDARRFTAARDAVQQARALLDQNRHDLPRVMYDDLKGQADALAARIGDAQARAEQQEQQQIDAARQADAQQSRLEAERAEYEQVQELLRRALAFQREQRYDRALELLDQALFHDPNNIAAQGLREVIAQSQRTQKFNALLKERDTMIGDHSIDNTDATRPFVPILNYPPDWPEISRRRLSGLTVTTEEGRLNEEVAERLRTRIDVQFDGNDLESVLNFIRDVTGVNMFVNWRALQGEGVEPDTPINLRLDGVPADQILRMVLGQASADAEFNPVEFSIVDGIVTISTRRDLTRTTMTRMYDIRDLLVNVPNFDEAPDFDLSSVLDSGGGGGGTGGGGGGVGGGQSLFGGDTGDEDDDQPDRGQRIQDIINLITDTVGQTEEWDVYGGDVSSIKELNGSLIIKTTADNHRGVLDLLAQLRETRAMQINVEARFLLVDQNFLNDVGVDVDLFVEDPGGNFGPISIAQDTFGLAVRQNTGLPGSFGVGSSDPIGDFSDTTGFPGSGRSLDVQFSYLDDIQVAVMIRATRANRRAVSLSAPRLTFMNGQKAFVIVARQIAFVSELEPVPEASGFNPTLDVVNSGVVLIVEGTISADRRYVTLTLEPSLATVATPIRTIPQIAENEAAQDETPTDDDEEEDEVIRAFIEAPEVELTQVKTTVNVPDKGTIMIGGQRLVGEIELEVGIPVLSKLPFFNRIFTNRSEVKDERTLLILVKPQIIIQSEEEEILFPGLNQELGL